MNVGSRFFSLAQKYVNNGDSHRLGILKILMNHHFDSTYTGCIPNFVRIPKNTAYTIFDIQVVLSDVGYSGYSLKEDKNHYIITLKNTL